MSLLKQLANNKTIYPPNCVKSNPFEPTVNVFLAGSIDMGGAKNWQPIVTQAIEHLPELGLIFNPRRLDFNAYEVQSINNDYFKTQVTWELDHLAEADIVFMYLDPNSKSPISLMELGWIAKANKTIVCCGHGFWRKGNVDILCAREGVPVFEDLPSAIQRLKDDIVKISKSKSISV